MVAFESLLLQDGACGVVLAFGEIDVYLYDDHVMGCQKALKESSSFGIRKVLCIVCVGHIRL